jgi:flagellar biosynthetic protein FliR
MLPQLTALPLFAGFLIFVRIGTILSLLPGFSAAFVNPRLRLLMALAVTVLLTPLLAPAMPPQPPTAAGLALVTISEVAVGLFLGGIARVAIAALHTAGTLAAYFSSLATALTNDPVADQQSATMAGFFTTFGLVLIFVTDAHQLMLRAFVDGYTLFPAGVPPSASLLAEVSARLLADSFALGLQLSMPFLIVGVVYQVGLGLLGRLMPQLPVFFFGMPLQIALQLCAIMITISGVFVVFLNQFAETVGALPSP